MSIDFVLTKPFEFACHIPKRRGYFGNGSIFTSQFNPIFFWVWGLNPLFA
jgi:hypothetical protein